MLPFEIPDEIGSILEQSLEVEVANSFRDVSHEVIIDLLNNNQNI